MTITVVLLALAVAAAIAVRAARRRWFLVEISGVSMQPVLAPGQVVRARRCPPAPALRGAVAVVDLPTDFPGTAPPVGPSATVVRSVEGRPAFPGEVTGTAGDRIVKRIAAVAGDPVPDSCAAVVRHRAERTIPPGFVLLLGDNADRSTDSRHFGLIPTSWITGIVTVPSRSPRQPPAEPEAADRSGQAV